MSSSLIKIFRRSLVGLLFATACVALQSLPTHAQERIALVIGNADYGAMGRLKNPVNDSRLMAATLRDLGFRVIELIDANQQDMKRGVRDFGRWLRRAGPDGVALFYYAGHGVQVSGRNYLLPVEAQILAEGDVDIESVAADSILEQMEHANTGVNIVILDACRNNPFQQGFRSASRGLARMEAPTGTYIAYATAPGQLAMDGDGPNSPFTRNLAEVIREPGLSIELVFKRVRQRVAALSEERQIPWSSSSLIGDFVFNRDGRVATPPAPQPAESQDSSPQVELLYWESIKDSDDPALFRDYRRRFPDGIFTAIAEARLRDLTAETSPPRERQTAMARPPVAKPGTGTAVRDRPTDCGSLLKAASSGPAPPYCLEIRRGGTFEISEQCGAISTHGLSDNRGRERNTYLNAGDFIAVTETQIVHYFGEETRCYWISANESDDLSGLDDWVIVIPEPNLRSIRLHESE